MPSCIETLTSANTLAASTRESPRSRTTSPTTLFQTANIEVDVPVPVAPIPAHTRAISVSSVVRTELSDLPTLFTSSKSAAYLELVGNGGGGGRNCVGVSSAKGTTLPAWVNTATGKLGGVDCQRPG